jgi:hypothetical protein
VLLTVLSRFALLQHGLPEVLGADEAVVLGRAQQVLHHHLPTEYDWPTGSMLLLAGWLRAVGRAGADAPYAAARVVFAAVATAQVLAGGLLGARLAKPGREVPTAAIAIAAGALAYPALRLGRVLHPDPLQALLITVALIAAVEVLRRPTWRWAAASGAAAGVAAGTKYLGGTVAVALVAAALLAPIDRWAARARLVAVGAGAALLGFVLSVPAAVAHPSELVDGLRGQLGHQSGGHLGYDGRGPSFWWHLATALPGAVGWPFLVASIAGLGALAWRGTAAHRVVAVHAAVGFVVVAWGVVRFPHYVLVYLPALGVLGAVALDRVLERAPRGAWRSAAAVAGAAVVFGGPGLHAVQLLRAEQARDTRVEAARVAAAIDGPIVKEQYTDASPIGDSVARLPMRPDLVGCGCVVEISSYNEERYRAEPDRYAREVAFYDGLRAAGEVVAVVRPSRPMSYRWDVLPQWGLDRTPLRGEVGLVGPTITFLRLPAPAGQPSSVPRIDTKLTISPG